MGDDAVVTTWAMTRLADDNPGYTARFGSPVVATLVAPRLLAADTCHVRTAKRVVGYYRHD